MNKRVRHRLIDLNAADKDELEAVPGLQGHGYDIVSYRNQRGRFDSLRQLNEVPGLANKVPDDISRHLRV